ncbi:hypothetical protein NDU88_008677 [Pleurodeles waltl]|uniref:Uncharacterized protein n=1 Tax=Pleurodeles waltl TaxID=8319 RepID=A0AAV7PTS3_PLEWA|nr:hypothetical protein NDU88_008677 [Pleurodeles waltl]
MEAGGGTVERATEGGQADVPSCIMLHAINSETAYFTLLLLRTISVLASCDSGYHTFISLWGRGALVALGRTGTPPPLHTPLKAAAVQKKPTTSSYALSPSKGWALRQLLAKHNTQRDWENE